MQLYELLYSGKFSTGKFSVGKFDDFWKTFPNCLV